MRDYGVKQEDLSGRREIAILLNIGKSLKEQRPRGTNKQY